MMTMLFTLGHKDSQAAIIPPAAYDDKGSSLDSIFADCLIDGPKAGVRDDSTTENVCVRVGSNRNSEVFVRRGASDTCHDSHV